MRAFSYLLALVVALGATDVVRADSFVVDQRNEPDLWTQYSISSFTPIGPEFTPQLSKLTTVELWIASQNGRGSADVTVRVWRGAVSTTLLGESEPSTIADGHDAPVRFTFLTPVDLTPGEVHVLEVVRTQGPGNVLWSGDKDDSYAGGRPLLGGNFIVGDFWFRTGADASVPVRASTWGELKARFR